MADATGILSKMAIKDVAGWTGAYSAVDNLIPFESETLTQNYTRLEDPSLIGTAGRAPSSQGVQACQGQTVHLLDYNNFDEIFATIFGFQSTRTFYPIDGLLAKWVWIEFEKQVSRWRFGPCKAMKFVISGEKDGIVRLTIDWIARDVDRSATAFPSLSVGAARNLIRFEDMTASFIDIASGPPSGSGPIKLVESFELELDHSLVPDDYTSNPVGNEVKLPLEPIPNGFRVGTVKMKVPRYDIDTDWMAWKDADTPIQGKFAFSRGGETLNLSFPDMRITEGLDAQIGGPERLQNEVTADLYKPDATNPLTNVAELHAVFT